MRKRVSSAALAATMLISAPVFAAPVPVITVDEYGHFTSNFLPAATGFISVEPVSGFPALTYILPFAGVPGDIVLIEPSTSQTSDIIRFPGNSRMYFFSDDPGDPEPGVLADVPVFPGAFAAVSPHVEIGAEGGLNGLFNYTPGPGGVGDDGSGLMTYNFISDIPEPASLSLVGAGAALLFVRRRRY